MYSITQMYLIDVIVPWHKCISSQKCIPIDTNQVGLACQTGLGIIVWPDYIIERFLKKHQLIDVIFFDDHQPTGKLPVFCQSSPRLETNVFHYTNVFQLLHDKNLFHYTNVFQLLHDTNLFHYTNVFQLLHDTNLFHYTNVFHYTNLFQLLHDTNLFHYTNVFQLLHDTNVFHYTNVFQLLHDTNLFHYTNVFHYTNLFHYTNVFQLLYDTNVFHYTNVSDCQWLVIVTWHKCIPSHRYVSNYPIVSNLWHDTI